MLDRNEESWTDACAREYEREREIERERER